MNLIEYKDFLFWPFNKLLFLNSKYLNWYYIIFLLLFLETYFIFTYKLMFQQMFCLNIKNLLIIYLFQNLLILLHQSNLAIYFKVLNLYEFNFFFNVKNIILLKSFNNTLWVIIEIISIGIFLLF